MSDKELAVIRAAIADYYATGPGGHGWRRSYEKLRNATVLLLVERAGFGGVCHACLQAIENKAGGEDE